MSLNSMRITLSVALLVALVVLACKVPQAMIESLGGETSETPVPGGTPTATHDETVVSPGLTQTPITAYPYPPQPTPAYPGAQEPTLPVPYPYPYPDPGFTQAPSPTWAYPAPDTAGSPTSTPVLAVTSTPTPEGQYPGPDDQSTLTFDPYPEPDGAVTPTPTSVLAVTPTWTSSFPYPPPDGTTTPTPTGTLLPLDTPTLLPTVTLTPTPTPIPSPTPLPPPLWVSSNLRATDPSTVRLASGRVQLVWFFAFWDGPSLAMAPLVHGLEDQYESRMNFIYLDIDDPANETFQEALGYRTQPHFFLLDPNGVVLLQWQGYVSVEEFRRAFDAALQ